MILPHKEVGNKACRGFRVLSRDEDETVEKIGENDGQQEYFSIAELAKRWRCSRGTVYNRLRVVGAEILDFALRGKKGKKAIRAKTVFQIEERKTRRFH